MSTWRLVKLGGHAAPGLSAAWRLVQLGGHIAVAAPITATAPATAEAFETIPISASGTGVPRWLITQTSGPAVVLSGVAPNWTYEAPGLIASASTTIAFSITAQTTSGDVVRTVSTDVYPANEFDLVGSVWVAVREVLL